jgi:hypothetical protein
MEKEVNVLLEESATANVEKKTDLALDRAKKAAQKERKLGTRTHHARRHTDRERHAYVHAYIRKRAVHFRACALECTYACVGGGGGGGG